MRALRWILAAAIVVVGGCDESGGVDAGAVDSGPTTDSGAPVDGGGADAAVGCAGDGNDSFGTAGPLTLGTPVTGAISCAGDVDHFGFDADEGDWIRITIVADPVMDARKLDTVLTLYSATGAPIAENDDIRVGYGSIGQDSQIITRLREAGRHLVAVRDFSDFDPDQDAEGNAAFTYTLRVARIAPADEDVIVADETGDDAASASTVRTSTVLVPREGGADLQVHAGYVAGTFRDADDVDVYAFEVIGDAETNPYAAWIDPTGADGNGSEQSIGSVWITDETGTTTWSRIDAREAPRFRIGPSLPAGRYLLWVDNGGSAVGAEPWYVLSFSELPIENPRETDDVANGALAGADTITLEDAAGGRAGFLLSFLPDASDIDYWAFDLAEGERFVNAGCAAQWDGSGVRGLTIEVRDSSDAVLGMQREIDRLPQQPLIRADVVMASGPGRFFVRLSSDGPDAMIVGQHARCGVRVGPVAP